MRYSLAWLLQQPTDLKYLSFWGHTPKQKDVVDKSCFSQWFPAAFEVAGDTYATAEHWMMAEQARQPGRWRGENLLGFALMEVRDQLRRS